MGPFEIIKRNGERIQLQTREPFCAVKSAVQNTSLMGDDNVQLSFVSSELIKLGEGDKILVFGEEYTIRTKVPREMLSETHYIYEATFYGAMYELMKSHYRNTDANGKSTQSTFDLTYSIKDFIKVLIYNVERDYPGVWKFDEANCPDTEPITIRFSKQNCLQVLQSLCSKDKFNFDFSITQSGGVRTIHIGKFGNKIVPPGGNSFFEWGKGSGLYRLKEDKVDDKAIVTRLWVEGGTNNIRRGYRDYSERLQLPYPKRLNKREHKLSDGTVIPANSEYIGIDDDNRRYFEDEELRDKLGSNEDSKDYEKIYPTRTGKVTALVDSDVNSFVDNTMDFDLCEKDGEGTKYLISGVTAKINFITGKLAGQQFELVADGGYIHSEKKFKLIPFTDERGLTIPTTGTNDAFRISVGDKYKITDINLPESYVEEAEEELWYAGFDDFLYMKQARAQYQLTLDRKYFIDSLPEDSDTTIFRVGDYVPVRDTRFGIEKNIRIQKVSRNLLLEHDYNLTLSDVTANSIFSQTVIDVIEHNQIIDNNRLRDLNKVRKGWRTTEELRNMVYDTDGYFDPENIRPNSIDTNMLTVGSKSQQFVLIDVVLEPNVNGIGNRLNASAGELAHLSMNKDDIKRWRMVASEFTMNNSDGYYLFAKCSKDGDRGIWYLTQKQLKFEPVEDPNNYYFQVGIISSLYKDGFRDFVSTYGFTRINGNTITTGKIVTSDNECYLDLDGNKFRIGDASSSIDWGVTKKNQLTLKNVKLVSQSGDTSHIGVYRGTYDPNYVYYKGDEVSYTSDGETCTYRYINTNPTSGNAPTNSTYWTAIAKGATGENGRTSYTHIAYADNSQGGGFSQNPAGKAYIGMYVDFVQQDSTDPSKYRWSLIKGQDGQNGTPGTPGKDGRTPYLHIAYANSADGRKDFHTVNGVGKSYIGQYVDYVQSDSTNPASYMWSKIKGEDGRPGQDVTPEEAAAQIEEKLRRMGMTEIDGGVMLSNMLQLRKTDNSTVTAGVSGVQGANKDLPSFWSGGTYSAALQNLVNILFRHDGYARLGLGDGSVTVFPDGRIRIGQLHLNSSGELEARDSNGTPRLVFNSKEIDTLSALIDQSDYNQSSQTDPRTMSNNTPRVELGRFGCSKDSVKMTVSGGISITSDGIDALAFGVCRVWMVNNLNNDEYELGVLRHVPDKQHKLSTHTIDLALHNMLHGQYVVYASYHRYGPTNNSLSVQTMSASVERINFRLTKSTDKKRTHFGRNGFLSYTSANQFIHYSDASGLTAKGPTNLPGVLAAGTVDKLGGVSNVWGAKASDRTAVKISPGKYRVYHDIGHQQYSVSVTPSTYYRHGRDWTASASYMDKGPNSFIVFLNEDDGDPVDVNFDFQCFGYNL